MILACFFVSRLRHRSSYYSLQGRSTCDGFQIIFMSSAMRQDALPKPPSKEDKERHRQAALHQHEPRYLLSSLPCTQFSATSDVDGMGAEKANTNGSKFLLLVPLAVDDSTSDSFGASTRS